MIYYPTGEKIMIENQMMPKDEHESQMTSEIHFSNKMETKDEESEA